MKNWSDLTLLYIEQKVQFCESPEENFWFHSLKTQMKQRMIYTICHYILPAPITEEEDEGGVNPCSMFPSWIGFCVDNLPTL